MPSKYSKALSMVFLYPQGQPLADPPRGGYILYKQQKMSFAEKMSFSVLILPPLHYDERNFAIQGQCLGVKAQMSTRI